VRREVRELHEVLERAARQRADALRLRVVPYERMSGWSSKASEAELKGAEGGD
jgi:hypothetical protein